MSKIFIFTKIFNSLLKSKIIKILKLLFFITPLFFTFSSYSQLPCDCDASNVIDLKNCLAEPTYDVICIVDNFSLDDPSVPLPLVVR